MVSGDARRMIDEDQLDRCARRRRHRGVEQRNEFASAVAGLDEGVDVAGDQIDAGKEADRPVALVLVVARKAHVPVGLRRQVRRGRGDRLNAGFTSFETAATASLLRPCAPRRRS